MSKLKTFNVLYVEHDTGECVERMLTNFGLDMIKGDVNNQVLHIWESATVNRKQA